MSSESQTYRRLTGKKKGFLVGYHNLWQGEDHLLQIYSRLGVEDYKRFYFTDIQAIITHQTDTGKIQNFVLGGLTGLFGLFAFTSGGGWSIFHGIVTGVMLLFLVFNIFKGPTCETFLLTAVQTEKLHSLHRLKTTEPVMNRLRALIEQVQSKHSGDFGATAPRWFHSSNTTLTAGHTQTTAKSRDVCKGKGAFGFICFAGGR